MARKRHDNQKSQFRACGIKIASFHHVCQDHASQGNFWHNGERIWYGVVSDGSSQSVGSEFGAKYLCEVFCEEVEKIYKEGLREDELLRELAYRITAKMARYTPKSTHSGLEKWGDNTVCSELYASLLGYIVNEDRALLILAGDGTLAINGGRQDIDQGSEGAIYPAFLLAYPESEWKAMAHNVYVFVSLPSARVESIMLASDGLEYMNNFPSIANDVGHLISTIYYEATVNDFPRHRLDDTSVVAITRNWPKIDNPLPDAAPKEICDEAEKASLTAIMQDVGNLRIEKIRHEDDRYRDLHFKVKHNSHHGSNSVLIEVLSTEMDVYNDVMARVKTKRMASDDTSNMEPTPISPVNIAKPYVKKRTGREIVPVEEIKMLPLRCCTRDNRQFEEAAILLATAQQEINKLPLSLKHDNSSWDPEKKLTLSMRLKMFITSFRPQPK